MMTIVTKCLQNLSITPSAPVSLIWFRNDLRVHDNPALWHANQQGHQVIGLFLDYQQQWISHGLGEARIAYIRQTVEALEQQLAKRQIPLVRISVDLFSDTEQVFSELAQHLNLTDLNFNIEYEVNERRRDITVCRWAKALDIPVNRFHDQCVVPPGEVLTRSGTPFRVYSPFKKAWLQQVQNFSLTPLSAPSCLADMEADTEAEVTASDTRDQPLCCDESQAHEQLQTFVEHKARQYNDTRDFPALATTSQLSPALAIGVLSPRQCFSAALQANDGRLSGGQPGLDSWINELIWREFYRHVAVAFPDVCKHRAFKPETERVLWRNPDQDAAAQSDFHAWCHGRTGYPIVDAAQRQLLETGWMHNRLRMITAMFLSKHLLIDWRLGEAFFNRHLLDADLCSNNGGWQWSASTGADGAPYFRIFNPVSQSQKFDPDGEFIARFVPELARLSPPSRHFPHPIERAQAGYPAAIVEHKFARERALNAFKQLSDSTEKAS